MAKIYVDKYPNATKEHQQQQQQQQKEADFYKSVKQIKFQYDPVVLFTSVCLLVCPHVNQLQSLSLSLTHTHTHAQVVEGLVVVPAMPVEQHFPKTLPANKRQISPTKFQDFTAKGIIDEQATLNSRPFLVPHSNTEQHKNLFFFLFFCPHHH